eukprot:comp20539_c0_seq1/m.26339 comp20539_c0_seq1/g.26339  ORF comp20539_c0_seq1/g.26339 comp20539_c0_seq1/m.26339 type:complete len:331 (-) comp20539_c0_seq1:287-1279(-)
MAEIQMWLSGNPLHRVGPQRSKPDAVDALKTRPDALFLPLSAKAYNPIVFKTETGPTRPLWIAKSDITDVIFTETDFVLLGVDTAVGAPKFAFVVDEESELAKSLLDGDEKSFMDARTATMGMGRDEASIVGQARAICFWNGHNLYCSLCGCRSSMAEAGYKRECSNDNCRSKKSVINTSYPRTDPTVIVLVASKDGERCLVGRQARWPKGMYSCLAGFVEAGESIEEAAAREVEEESGVKIGLSARYMFSQPWPFPASLMLGMVAVAETEDIDLHDQELEDARWLTRSEVVTALNAKYGSDAPVFVPPPQTIAHQLIKAWVDRRTPMDN